MEYILLIGNFTFEHNLTELELRFFFSTENERKALCHEIYSVQLFDNLEKAYEASEDAELSFVIIPEYDGEIAFETEKLRQEVVTEMNYLTSKVKL